MKKIIKLLIFVVIFIVIWNNIFSIIWLTPTPISEFYDEPNNSLDVIYIGASNAFAHFNTTLAFHEYGFTTGLLSSNSQPIVAVKYLLEEAKKRQNPNVYVIDISASNEMNLEEGAIRSVTDSLRPSVNRFNAVKSILSYSDIPKEEYINYYFSFLKYHTLWKGINQDYFKNQILFKGYLFCDLTIGVQKIEPNPWNYDLLDIIPTKIEDVLLDLLDYIKENELKVLFIVTPRLIKPEHMAVLNHNIKIIEDNGFEVLNMNDKPEIGIDYSTDLYNEAHINVWGATKYTRYFANYLDNKYNLADHRDDKKYSSWNEEYERFKESYAKLTQKDFEDL